MGKQKREDIGKETKGLPIDKPQSQHVAESPLKEETPTDEPKEEGETDLSAPELAQKYLENWQRAQADFANYKKRSEQDRLEYTKFANALLMTSLLPVIDDMERALQNMPESADTGWTKGIELIYKKLMNELENQGLLKIESEGKDFDPNFHQAVLYEEGEEGKVIEELQKGYMLNDRLLRPSMVKVGKGK